jgi:hypothetical protein
LEWHQKARVVSEKLVRDALSEVLYRLVLARNLFHIARCQNETGHPVEARRAFEESAALWKRLAEEKPLQASFQRDLAACYRAIPAETKSAAAADASRSSPAKVPSRRPMALPSGWTLGLLTGVMDEFLYRLSLRKRTK